MGPLELEAVLPDGLIPSQRKRRYIYTCNLSGATGKSTYFLGHYGYCKGAVPGDLPARTG